MKQRARRQRAAKKAGTFVQTMERTYRRIGPTNSSLTLWRQTMQRRRLKAIKAGEPMPLWLKRLPVQSR
jgi:hypothetical protein